MKPDPNNFGLRVRLNTAVLRHIEDIPIHDLNWGVKRKGEAFVMVLPSAPGRPSVQLEDGGGQAVAIVARTPFDWERAEDDGYVDEIGALLAGEVRENYKRLSVPS